MNTKQIVNGIAVIICLIFVTTQVMGDHFMKQKRHTDAVQIMGQQQPAEDITEEIWISEKGIRSDNPKQSMIILSELNKGFMLNHQDKSYTEMNFKLSEIPSGMKTEENKEDMAAFQQMMKSMMKIDATVTETGEKKKIKEWNCVKYILQLNMGIGQAEKEIWATEDIDIDSEIYSKFNFSEMMGMPGMQEALGQIMEEMKKIRGVQVFTKSTQNIMNQTFQSTTELVEFKTGKAPAHVFEIPAGYTKKQINPFE